MHHSSIRSYILRLWWEGETDCQTARISLTPILLDEQVALPERLGFGTLAELLSYLEQCGPQSGVSPTSAEIHSTP